MFLVAGMLCPASSIAAVVILFRLLHPIAMAYIMVCLFGDVEMTKKVWRIRINGKIWPTLNCQANILYGGYYSIKYVRCDHSADDVMERK